MNILEILLRTYRKNRSRWHRQALSFFVLFSVVFLLAVFPASQLTASSRDRLSEYVDARAIRNIISNSETQSFKYLLGLPNERWSQYRLGRYVPENDTELPATERPNPYTFLCVTPDLVCDSMLSNGGFWDREFVHNVFTLVRRLSKPTAGRGKIVMDVGMNYGSFALFAAALGHRVHSFEMQPDVAATVALSARLNTAIAQRLTIHQYAIDEKPSKDVHYARYEGNIGMAHIKSADDSEDTVQSISVESIRLDTLLDRWQRQSGERIQGIFFMKIDVEGHDMNALRSLGQRWLQKVDHLVLEVNSYTPVYREVAPYLVVRGFLCQPLGDDQTPHPHRFSSDPSVKIPSYGAMWCARAPVVRQLRHAQYKLAMRSAESP
jgi:FkbM family methyltransferase